jgi:hypothetical protein
MAISRGLVDSLDQEFIIQQPVSERRERNLRENYLRERQLTRTTEMIFDRVGALETEHLPPPDGVRDFGFKSIVFKHSFIDGISSLIVSARDWAVRQEDFLLRHLEEKLRGAVSGRLGTDVDRDPSSILDAFGGPAADLRGQGYSPSAFLVTGSLGQPLYEALQHNTQDPWAWYPWPGPNLRATHRFVGAHAGIPIVAIEPSPEPRLYTVDLARFATLTRYGEGADFEPEFTVKPFTDDEARDVLARQPNLILDPPPGSGQDEERIRQLQLRVGLELWETYKLEVKDPGAVIARPLADPVYE